MRLMLQELLEERDQAVLKQNIAQFYTKQAISELEVMKVELQCSQSSLISAYDNQAPLISQIEQLKVERAETAIHLECTSKKFLQSKVRMNRKKLKFGE